MEIDKIDNVIQNLKEMIIARNENIDEFEEHEVEVEREEFYNDNKLITFYTEKTAILFALTKNLRTQIIDNLKKNKPNLDLFVKDYNGKYNIILIFNNDLLTTPSINQLSIIDKLLQKKDGMLQYFHINELLFNPTKHELVPKHRKLEPDEIKEVMDKYLIKSKLQMPLILHTDRIAKWIGLKQGDIIEITRYNENSGKIFYYRCCV
jgi:DNA-directed RNA polymerase I, II, and III subunit RPABC1